MCLRTRCGEAQLWHTIDSCQIACLLSIDYMLCNLQDDVTATAGFLERLVEVLAQPLGAWGESAGFLRLSKEMEREDLGKSTLFQEY